VVPLRIFLARKFDHLHSNQNFVTPAKAGARLLFASNSFEKLATKRCCGPESPAPAFAGVTVGKGDQGPPTFPASVKLATEGE
jgi:hypothetical protein